MHRFIEDYYRRMYALTFAVKHDDGMGLEDLDRADIILVGVSRTSKTPLSIYLAVRGYLVANIPILFNVEPPPKLFQAVERKLVCLRMDPVRLRHIREQRLRSFREDARQAYIDAHTVQREVAYSDQPFKRASWPVVDTSLKSLEETAVEVLSLATDLPYKRIPEER